MPKTLELGPKEKALVDKLISNAEKQTVKHMSELVSRFQKRFNSVTRTDTECRTNRANHPNLWPIMETFGGATLPPVALYNKSYKAMADLRAAIAGRKWTSLQAAIKMAEAAINKYDVAVTDYVNKVVTGSNRSVSALSFTKTAGMVALGVLCVTFAAPAATAALAEAGVVGAVAEGTYTAAMIHGSLGAFMATQIKGVASATGKIAVDEAKSINCKAHLYDTAYQTVFGLFAGAGAKGLNLKLSKFFSKNPKLASSLIKTRVSVGTMKSAVESIAGDVGKKRASAVAKKTAKNMTGRETQTELELLAFMNFVQDPVIKKALAAKLLELHKKEREYGPFPKK